MTKLADVNGGRKMSTLWMKERGGRMPSRSSGRAKRANAYAAPDNNGTNAHPPQGAALIAGTISSTTRR
eukprot:12813713-Alexandrium_andersonii.AAC.1